MAFTRFHDDSARITKNLQQSTDQGRWILDTPGNGVKPPFMEDPHIIPQKWGANLWTDYTDVQSTLMGLTKRVNRDFVGTQEYKRQTLHTAPITYPVSSQLTTEQSRAIMPAWTARDLTQNHGYILFKDPQAHTQMPFKSNQSSRIMERDNFIRHDIPKNEQSDMQIGGPN